jgi:hypothetical protein
MQIQVYFYTHGLNLHITGFEFHFSPTGAPEIKKSKKHRTKKKLERNPKKPQPPKKKLDRNKKKLQNKLIYKTRRAPKPDLKSDPCMKGM